MENCTLPPCNGRDVLCSSAADVDRSTQENKKENRHDQLSRPEDLARRSELVRCFDPYLLAALRYRPHLRRSGSSRTHGVPERCVSSYTLALFTATRVIGGQVALQKPCCESRRYNSGTGAARLVLSCRRTSYRTDHAARAKRERWSTTPFLRPRRY